MGRNVKNPYFQNFLLVFNPYSHPSVGIVIKSKYYNLNQHPQERRSDFFLKNEIHTPLPDPCNNQKIRGEVKNWCQIINRHPQIRINKLCAEKKIYTRDLNPGLLDNGLALQLYLSGCLRLCKSLKKYLNRFRNRDKKALMVRNPVK